MSPARSRTQIAWGGIDQGLSSATNLGLSILAGRFLGAAGLGSVFLGFAACLFSLSLVRGFITSPFVVATSALGRSDRDRATKRCMTLVPCAALAVGVVMAGIGLVVPDPFGRSLLVFSPCAVAVIIQDQWRSILFRDQRGSGAAFNDGVWAVVMLAMLPVVWVYPHDWTVAAAWGGGAAGAALVGFAQVRLRPARPGVAARWWNQELRRLGSWLAVESVIIAVGAQATIVMLAAILGRSDLGGIRVVQVVFAPMTLIGEALHYPGVPIMSRALTVSLADPRRWARRLGLGALALIGCYLGVIGPFRSQVLAHVFGPEFVKYTPLVLPIALGQVVWAASIGFLILLKADRRVHAIIGCITANWIATLTLVPILASRYGVLGGAWGLACGPFAGSMMAIFFGQLPADIPLWSRTKVLVTTE